jgi:hypothetical protein
MNCVIEIGTSIVRAEIREKAVFPAVEQTYDLLARDIQGQANQPIWL